MSTIRDFAEMFKGMRILVTRKHITEGQRCVCSGCPVALGLRQATRKKWTPLVALGLDPQQVKCWAGPSFLGIEYHHNDGRKWTVYYPTTEKSKEFHVCF